MERNIDPELERFADYLADPAVWDPARHPDSALAQWVREDPARLEELGALHRAWTLAKHRRAPDPQFRPKVAEAVMARIEADRRAPRSVRPSRSFAWFSDVGRTSRAVALSSLALALALTGVYAVHHQKAPSSASAAVYRTPTGERATVRMADGSRMILGPSTTVTVRADTVMVDGAALFSVTPHPDRPFIVRTTNALVRVLGTTFMVRHYASEPRSQIVVQDGRVALHALAGRVVDRAPTILTPGMAGWATDSSIAVSKGVNVDDYVGWTQGRLVFREAPLEDVVTELARVYGTKIRIADTALVHEPVTMAVFVDQESLPKVLRDIGLVTGTRFTRDQNGFLLMAAPGAFQGVPVKPFPQPEKSYGK